VPACASAQTFLLGFPSLTLLKKRYAGAAAKAS
jgi:hypothetical protein